MEPDVEFVGLVELAFPPEPEAPFEAPVDDVASYGNPIEADEYADAPEDNPDPPYDPGDPPDDVELELVDDVSPDDPDLVVVVAGSETMS